MYVCMFSMSVTCNVAATVLHLICILLTPRSILLSCLRSVEPRLKNLAMPPPIAFQVHQASIAGMTITALKSHLKHYKLPVTGKESVLVDRLHSHLHSSRASISVDMLDSNTSNSQQHAQVVNVSRNASSQQSSPLQMGENSPAIPQQLLNQLTAILQQAQSPTSTGVAHATPMQLDTIEDDRLSAASLPVQSNPFPYRRPQHLSKLICCTHLLQLQCYPYFPSLHYLPSLQRFKKG